MPQTPSHRRLLGALLVLLPLGACGWFSDDDRLPGDRVAVRQAVREASAASVAIPRALPPVTTNAAWTQKGGDAARPGGNLAGPAALARAWSADAGTGNSSRSVVTAEPVVAGGTVYTLDAAAEVRAFDAAGGALRWRTSLVPDRAEKGEEGFGGGLAIERDRLIAATGFGEVLALDAASGEILWRRGFGAPFRAGPAVAGGRIVAVARTSQAFALGIEDGAVLWRVQGVGADSGFLGGASPAIAGSGTIVPFSSGELVALEIVTGRRFWGTVITGGRRGLARAAITDLTGDPVVIGPLVVTANQSGRLAALEARTGRRVWTRALGTTRRIWAAGDTLFLVSDTAELHRIDAATGESLWSRQLRAYEDEEDREGPITYSGPVLASGRVVLSDGLGNLWSFDANTGEGAVAAAVPGGSTTGPVIAGGTLFVLSDDAVLHAFR